jgi:DNA-binding NarL/FixJ family response regulator
MQDDPPSVTTILIVDDHPMVRDGLRARLSSVPHLAVVGEADNLAEALELAARLQPKIVLSDIAIKGGGTGIELTRQLTEQQPGISVLILSMHDGAEYVQQAMAAGARGYIVKDAPSHQILAAIESVAVGGTYLSPSVSDLLFRARGEDRSLSARETEILACLAKGQSSKQMAKAMDISVRTVESHRQSIKRKFNLSGQAELVSFAVRRQGQS